MKYASRVAVHHAHKHRCCANSHYFASEISVSTEDPQSPTEEANDSKWTFAAVIVASLMGAVVTLSAFAPASETSCYPALYNTIDSLTSKVNAPKKCAICGSGAAYSCDEHAAHIATNDNACATPCSNPAKSER